MRPTAEAYVVDASVAVKWYLLGEVLNEPANSLYRGHVEREHVLVAPAHIHCEVPSAIVAATRGNSARISIDEGRTAVVEFLTLNIRTVPTHELVLNAFALVHEFQISIYDALYLALTLGYRIPLITADARFYRQVAALPDVVWLGDITDD